MEFNEVPELNDFRIKSIFSAYCATFPENERRSKIQFENLFQQPDAKVFSILNNSNFIGYFIIWELDDFAFLEHFEIFKEYRNRSFGAEVLKKLTEHYSKIILETEPKNFSEIAGKRIKLYLRNGYNQILDSYVQPSYGDGKASLELLLFANFQPENLERITQNIYDVVYGN